MLKKISKILLVTLVVLMFVPNNINAADSDVKEIELNSTENADGTYSFEVTVDGKEVNEYDYCWHIDINGDYSEKKNSPGEYYTGTEPTDEDIYIAHDIYYYPEIDTSLYSKAKYGDDTEWVCFYQNEKYSQYVFATLPVEGSDVPTRMMHSESEAYNNAVLHITKAGTYKLTGNWHGQIFVDLGDDSFDDETAVVTLILDNVDINCTVASGICFYQVYECDNTWEDREEALTSIDTLKAGANIVIADDSTNSVHGANIYRILKTKYKDDQSTDALPEQKKVLKVDGGVYSYMSLNVMGQTKGNGVLNINSEFEGLDSELHLTINGGNINITSDNDGINVNEDGVSIFKMNGGTLQILAGTGSEGDGIDSNGYLIINGGTVISSAKEQADSGLDSDMGTFINGGTVVAFGSSMDTVDEYSEDAQVVSMNLIFSQRQNITDGVVFTDEDGNGVFGFDLSDNDLFKDANRTYQCLVVATKNFTVGDKYNVYQTSSIKGTDTNGVYTKVTKYSETAQFAYGSNSKGGMTPGGGGIIPGQQGGGDFDPTEIPDMPDGDNDQQPGDFTPGQQGGDFDPNQQGGTQQPGGNFNPNQNGNNQGEAISTDTNNDQQTPTITIPDMTTAVSENTLFEATDKVNTYSSVTTVSIVADTTGNMSLPTWAFILCLVGSLAVGAVIGGLIVKVNVLKKKQTNN